MCVIDIKPERYSLTMPSKVPGEKVLGGALRVYRIELVTVR